MSPKIQYLQYIINDLSWALRFELFVYFLLLFLLGFSRATPFRISALLPMYFNPRFIFWSVETCHLNSAVLSFKLYFLKILIAVGKSGIIALLPCLLSCLTQYHEVVQEHAKKHGVKYRTDTLDIKYTKSTPLIARFCLVLDIAKKVKTCELIFCRPLLFLHRCFEVPSGFEPL